jgi:hypothetical protein
MTSFSIYAGDAQHCAQLDYTRGEHCGSTSSFGITVTNTCNENIGVKVCIQRRNGKWNCGLDSKLRPNESNNGFWVCKAHTYPKYDYDACFGNVYTNNCLTLNP